MTSVVLISTEKEIHSGHAISFAVAQPLFLDEEQNRRKWVLHGGRFNVMKKIAVVELLPQKIDK